MCNITELGMCSSIFFILFFIFYFVCQPFPFGNRLGAAPRPWVSGAGWNFSPTRGEISLEGTQAGRAQSSTPHPRVSTGAFPGNWRLWLHNCKLQISEGHFFLIGWPLGGKKIILCNYPNPQSIFVSLKIKTEWKPIVVFGARQF